MFHVFGMLFFFLLESLTPGRLSWKQLLSGCMNNAGCAGQDVFSGCPKKLRRLAILESTQNEMSQ